MIWSYKEAKFTFHFSMTFLRTMQLSEDYESASKALSLLMLLPYELEL